MKNINLKFSRKLNNDLHERCPAHYLPLAFAFKHICVTSFMKFFFFVSLLLNYWHLIGELKTGHVSLFLWNLIWNLITTRSCKISVSLNVFLKDIANFWIRLDSDFVVGPNASNSWTKVMKFLIFIGMISWHTKLASSPV